jgi:hypothetical protein
MVRHAKAEGSISRAIEISSTLATSPSVAHTRRTLFHRSHDRMQPEPPTWRFDGRQGSESRDRCGIRRSLLALPAAPPARCFLPGSTTPRQRDLPAAARGVGAHCEDEVGEAVDRKEEQEARCGGQSPASRRVSTRIGRGARRLCSGARQGLFQRRFERTSREDVTHHEIPWGLGARDRGLKTAFRRQPSAPAPEPRAPGLEPSTSDICEQLPSGVA